MNISIIYGDSRITLINILYITYVYIAHIFRLLLKFINMTREEKKENIFPSI